MFSTLTWRLRAATTLALCLAACGGGELLVIPLFTFTFVGNTGGAGSEQIQIFLQPAATTTSSGNFGQVNLTVTDASSTETQYPYTGSYSGCGFDIRFDTTSPKAPPTAPVATSYSGRFTGADTIELRPTGASSLPVVTLTRTTLLKQDFGC